MGGGDLVVGVYCSCVWGLGFDAFRLVGFDVGGWWCCGTVGFSSCLWFGWIVWWDLVFGCCLVRFCLTCFDWLVAMLVCLCFGVVCLCVICLMVCGLKRLFNFELWFVVVMRCLVVSIGCCRLLLIGAVDFGGLGLFCLLWAWRCCLVGCSGCGALRVWIVGLF